MNNLSVKLDIATIKKNIPLIIIVLSSILGLFLVSGLFKDGVLSNIDHSIHYSRINCLDKSNFFIPATWCAEFQAGMPTESYYPGLIDLFVVMLGKIIGLNLAYKLIVALTLFIPAIGAFMLLNTLGKKLAGSFAYAFILLNPGSWHIGGFEEVILVGLWPQVITAGFFLIALSLFINFLRKPNYKTLILAVISTLFFNHPYTLVAATTAYLAIIIFQFRQINKRWLGYFLSSTTLIYSYYLIPLFFNLKYISRGFSISWMDFNSLNSYLLQKIPWYILVSALIGLIFTLIKKQNQSEKYFSIAALALLANFIVSFIRPLSGSWNIGIRMEVFISFFIFMFASLFLEYLTKFKLKIDKKSIKLNSLIVAILFIVLIFSNVNTAIGMKKSVIVIPEQQIKDIYKPLSNLGDGRILTEETLYNAGQNFLTITHFHMLIPVYSGKEIIGIPFNFPPARILETTEKGMMFAKKLQNYAPGEMEYLFDHYNIRYIIAHSPMYLGFFENRTKSKTQIGPFTLFETNITPSYFKIIGNGKTNNELYQKTYAKTIVIIQENSKVALKVNEISNWKIKVDGKEVKRESCDGIICAEVNQGVHTVEFIYGYNALNYTGYLFSLAGIMLLAIIPKIERGKNNEKKQRTKKNRKQKKR